MSRKLAILIGRVEVGPPKSASAVRVVALTAVAVEALRKQMGQGGYVDEGLDALIFIEVKGSHLQDGPG